MKSISEVMDSYDIEVLMNEEAQFKKAEAEANNEEYQEQLYEENMRKFLIEMSNNYKEDYYRLIDEVKELSEEYGLDLSFEEAQDVFLDYVA